MLCLILKHFARPSQRRRAKKLGGCYELERTAAKTTAAYRAHFFLVNSKGSPHSHFKLLGLLRCVAEEPTLVSRTLDTVVDDVDSAGGPKSMGGWSASLNLETPAAHTVP